MDTTATQHAPAVGDGTAGLPELWRSMPADVRNTLSWLAHLLDANIPVRAAIDDQEYAQRFLGVTPASMVVVGESLGSFTAPLVAYALAGDMRRTPPVEVAGNESDESPVWYRLKLDDETHSVPGEMVLAFESGTLLDVPIVVGLMNRWDGRRLSLFVRDADADVAHAYLRDLLDRARGPENYLRGRCLEVRADDDGDLVVRHIRTPRATRADVVVPDRVWQELDANVRVLFGRRELLDELGLGTNRGVMLFGPPGTGKSALCRVLAAELAGDVTVVFCTAKVIAAHLNDVYEELTRLSPALVVLEDLDLIVGNRRDGVSSALHGFLTALDGAFTRHEGVVTVATTNDPTGLDEAAKRAARFDRFVEVPLPATDQRAAILARYLGRLRGQVDVTVVAGVTEGASGADLRELVRAAVIAGGDGVDTAALLAAAGQRWPGLRRVGAYL